MSWLFDRLASFSSDRVFCWRDKAQTYAELLANVKEWSARLEREGVVAGDVVAFEGEYSPGTSALLLALLERRCIALPVSPANRAKKGDLLRIGRADVLVDFDADDSATCQRLPVKPEEHELLKRLRDGRRAGLIIMSSGSTGEPKAAVYDFEQFLAKFEKPRGKTRTLVFLMLDHIGGLNTLFSILSSGGTAISVEKREAEAVAKAVALHRVQVLPTTPTFLQLLLMSDAHLRHDLSSLELITYGTEPMPTTTLKEVNRLFPSVRLKQTYGLTELGIFRTHSRDSSSLWVKVGGEGVESKVVDGILWIRTQNAMMGYLNAPSPFDSEGWYCTGDSVETDGEYLLIRGRASELINVGGEKVYPAEVEAALLEVENVADATVRGKRNPITGNVVTATIRLRSPEDPSAAEKRIREACKQKLAPYKVPALILFSEKDQHGARFKKARTEWS